MLSLPTSQPIALIRITIALSMRRANLETRVGGCQCEKNRIVWFVTFHVSVFPRLRVGLLNEEMRDSDVGNGDDDTFHQVVKDFSRMASDSPEKLSRRSGHELDPPPPSA